MDEAAALQVRVPGLSLQSLLVQQVQQARAIQMGLLGLWAAFRGLIGSLEH